MTRVMKDSGIKWLGLIPQNWSITKYKYFAKSGMGNTILTEQLSENGIPVYSATQENKLFGFVPSSRLELKKGDFVIPARGNSIGYVKVVDFPVATCTQTTIYSKINNINNKFLFYCSMGLKDYWFEFDDTAIPQITVNQVQNNLVPVPELDEQQKIVDFLDDKVSEIDSIINNTKHSIHELKDYKKSLLSEKITKGLNLNVELKNSGIEWLGYIPKHWTISKLKNIFDIRKNIANKLGYDVLSVTQQGLKVKNIESNEGQLSSDYSKYQIVEVNDFVMNHMDLLTGWVDRSNYVGVTSPDYRVFRFKNNINFEHDYFKYLLQFCYMNQVFYGYGQGVSNLGRWRLPTDEFLNFYFPVPEKEEQTSIVKFLNDKNEKIENLIKQKELLIEEMGNYKKSLIYEYVTGKKEVL